MSQETDKQNTTTSSPNDRDAARWYAFKVFYNKVFDIESHLLKTGIRSYLPSETITVERGGVRKKERRPLVPSLIFFQCGERLAEELRGGLEGRVLLYKNTLGHPGQGNGDIHAGNLRRQGRTGVSGRRQPPLQEGRKSQGDRHLIHPSVLPGKNR